MSKRATIKGRSMSQELSSRLGIKDSKAKSTFVGRAEQKPSEPKPAPQGIGKFNG